MYGLREANEGTEAHLCISDQIWEWDMPEPGTTPLKWKLKYPEQPNSDI